MSNVHGLFSGKKEEDSDDEREDRFVGGIDSRGGGSGLAVQPNMDESGVPPASGAQDSIFHLAESMGADGGDSGGGDGGVRRTITMYRNGFVVDDGPYRRLDDPANAEFLRSLAAGQTPRELLESGGSGDITVGLVDKRKEDYVERFQSFSGAGTSLGGTTTATTTDGVLQLHSIPSTISTVDESLPTTSIQVRLLNGKRKVIKMNLQSTIMDFATHLREDVTGEESFRLVSGFPPKPLLDFQMTIEAAGLKGAQVSMQKI